MLKFGMDNDQLLVLFDREQRIELQELGEVERQVSGQVIRNVNHKDCVGFIAYSKMDAGSADEQIEAQLSFFRSLGYEFEWKVFDHDTPPDLCQRLAALGFEIEDREALMVLDTEDAPDFFASVDTSVVQRLSDPGEIAGIIQMEDEVWGYSHERLGQWLARDMAENPDRLSIYTAQSDGRIVSAAWVYFHPPTRFASLWGGSTLPAYRKRGYYTALLVARAREARERGFRFLYVDASPMSRPILEKHGFVCLSYSTPCKWKPDKI
jgi:ribosomal protein S18 acetylase RimI-like enzyme